MKKVTSNNYKKDKLYTGVVRAVKELLEISSVVTPIDVLLMTGRVSSQQVEDWRFGRISYLERVCLGNLGKLNRLLRILDLHARAIGLEPSQTIYRKWGKGGKRITLVFTKSRNRNLEAAYSRHYIIKRPRKQSEQSSAPGIPHSSNPKPNKEPKCGKTETKEKIASASRCEECGGPTSQGIGQTD